MKIYQKNLNIKEQNQAKNEYKNETKNRAENCGATETKKKKAKKSEAKNCK